MSAWRVTYRNKDALVKQISLLSPFNQTAFCSAERHVATLQSANVFDFPSNAIDTKGHSTHILRHSASGQWRGAHSTAEPGVDEGVRKSRLWSVLGVAGSIGALLFWKLEHGRPLEAAAVAGNLRKDLPTFSRDEVAKRNTIQGKIWVTYKNGVYDITSYVPKHPGGSKIMMGAGGSIEPFWKLYAAHENPEMYALLETFRIGNVIEEDKSKTMDMADPFRNDPVRHPALRPNSVKPFNAEPPGPLLVDNFTTPNELFFVRNHLPVPKVDGNKYKLAVSAEGSRKVVSLSLKDLKTKYRKHQIPVTIQCAGNRRIEMSQAKNVRGLSWQSTAISTAVWSGARLSDVLKDAGIDIDSKEFDHIQFEGFDKDPEGSSYGASVPITLARDRRHDIILAYEMNGEEIPQDHGYPIRAIIPGVVGARQVKWLSKISLSKKESNSHWQQKDYKGFNPSVDWDTVDFSKANAIQDLPVVSTICEPEAGTVLEAGDDEVVIKGYAFSGGGRGIIRVDVSADGGKTWHTAELLDGAEQNPYRAWAWTLWEAVVPVPANHKGKVELVCKAIDSSYNVQPDNIQGIWNLRGLLNNAWHRVAVSVPKA